MPPRTSPSEAARQPDGSRVWRIALLLVLLDAALTAGFVFRGPVEGDTLRYALSLERWSAGRSAFDELFNVEMSFGWYRALAAWRDLVDVPLADLPTFLNWSSWLGGLLATAGLFLWWRRWWDDGIGFRLTVLFMLTPAFWSLHLYGNTNILGLALTAWACALLPGRRPPKSPHPIPEPQSDRARRRERGRTALAFGAATLLGWAAVTTRTDVLMLAPALLAWHLWGRERPSLRTAAAFGALVVLGYLGFRALALDSGDGGGTVGHHWKSNLDLGNPAWLARSAAQNLAALASAGPPLVLLASFAAFLTLRAPALRRTVLLWLLPALVFVVFGRMHLTRILLPLLPAALLPLAVWAARDRGSAGEQRSDRPGTPGSPGRSTGSARSPISAIGRSIGRRDAALAGVLVLGHVTLALVPAIQNRLSDRDPATRRVGHYAFKDVVVRQHRDIQALAEETRADARALFDRAERTGAPVVVIGGEFLFYEYELALRAPAVAVETVRSEYQLRLREARVPGRQAPYYFLEPRWGTDTEADLARLGLGPEVERHWIPVERRLRGMPPAASDGSSR